MGGTIYNTHTWSLLGLGPGDLTLKELKNLLPSFMFILSITLPNFTIGPDGYFPVLLSTLDNNFLVQRMRHDRNRRPYELRICDRCDWHTIQDEEHILLDCSHDHLVRLRTQLQLIFPPQFEDGPARLRTFMNQPDIFGVASFVAKCLALFP